MQGDRKHCVQLYVIIRRLTIIACKLSLELKTQDQRQERDNLSVGEEKGQRAIAKETKEIKPKII